MAVEIADVSIDRAAVAHWTKAVGLEEGVAAPLGRPGGTAREKALDVLISANWLIGEAATHGLDVSNARVARRVHERIGSLPNGRSEFEEEISSLGRTVADVEFEIKAESAAAALRTMVSSAVPPVTRADVASYYEQHRAQFHVPRLRLVDLSESIPTRAAAIALGQRIGPGDRFAKRSLHERVAKETPEEGARRGNGGLVHLIMTAPVGKIAGPVKFKRAWVLVVVRKVIPARVRPLGAVAAEISSRLSAERHHLAMSSFLEAFRSRWVAKTDCRPGYIVQKCSRYHGPMTPESNPLTGA